MFIVGRRPSNLHLHIQSARSNGFGIGITIPARQKAKPQMKQLKRTPAGVRDCETDRRRRRRCAIAIAEVEMPPTEPLLFSYLFISFFISLSHCSHIYDFPFGVLVCVCALR